MQFCNAGHCRERGACSTRQARWQAGKIQTRERREVVETMLLLALKNNTVTFDDAYIERVVYKHSKRAILPLTVTLLAQGR